MQQETDLIGIRYLSLELNDGGLLEFYSNILLQIVVWFKPGWSSSSRVGNSWISLGRCWDYWESDLGSNWVSDCRQPAWCCEFSELFYLPVSNMFLHPALTCSLHFGSLTTSGLVYVIFLMPMWMKEIMYFIFKIPAFSNVEILCMTRIWCCKVSLPLCFWMQVAIFLIQRNRQALLGRSIDDVEMRRVINLLVADPVWFLFSCWPIRFGLVGIHEPCSF